MSKDFRLERFLVAQDPDYDGVLAELRSGRKCGHWMWYVFPQIRGLGTSEMATRYAISSAEEATAYFTHPILGARLRECTQLAVNLPGKTAVEVFGHVDSLKFRSCLTLFSHVAPDCDVFQKALDMYYGGQRDQLTLTILKHA